MIGDGPVARAAPRGGITSAAVAAQRLGGGRAGANRSGAAWGRAGQRGPGVLARLGGRLPRIRPLKALTVGAFGVALVGIVANAMVFQRGHHPSPLFGLGRSVDGASDQAAQHAAPASAPGTSATAPAAGAPTERTGTISPAPAAADPAPPAAAPAPKPPAPVHRAAKVHPDDPANPKTAAAHPRPGRPAPAHARAENKPDNKRASAAEAVSAPRSDPLGKLIAGSARPARAETKPAPAPHAPAKPDASAEHANAAAVDAAPARPHRRLAAAAPAAAPAGKAPAARTE